MNVDPFLTKRHEKHPALVPKRMNVDPFYIAFDVERRKLDPRKWKLDESMRNAQQQQVSVDHLADLLDFQNLTGLHALKWTLP